MFENVSCGSRRWDGFIFFKEKEAVSPEYGSGITAFESFEALSVVSLSAGVAEARKISSQGFPSAPMAKGGNWRLGGVMVRVWRCPPRTRG